MIRLRFGEEFDETKLIDFIKTSGRRYIVQGQRAVILVNHTKPNSLDVWLRGIFTARQNTKLADNFVIDALIATGKFEIAKEVCPDSGRTCKAIRLT